MSTSIEVSTPSIENKDDDKNTSHDAVQLEDVLNAEWYQIKRIRDSRAKAYEIPPAEPSLVPKHPAPLKLEETPLAPIPGRHATAADKPEWQIKDNDKGHTSKTWLDVIANAHEQRLVGLALSGGGIRSATFNLGVLQALAALRLLYRVDYLSTVSGGGYIGAWLAAWTKRRGSFNQVGTRKAGLAGFGQVQTELDPNRVNLKDDNEPSPVRFLRIFSNYLTPKLGLFSGDTWALVAIYLRNLLLNLVIVVAMVSFLLFLPRVAQTWTLAAPRSPAMDHILVALVVVSLFFAFLTILKNMADLDSVAVSGPNASDKHQQAGGLVTTVPEKPKKLRERVKQLSTTQVGVLLFADVPLFAAAVVTGVWLALRLSELRRLPIGALAGIGAFLYAVIWSLATAFTYRKRTAPQDSKKTAADAARLTPPKEQASKASRITTNANAGERSAHESTGQLKAVWAGVLSASTAGALAGWLYAHLARVQWGHVPKTFTWDVPNALTLGVPAMVGIFVLAGVLQIGLMGTTFPDWKREWWGRLGGWLLLFGTVWLVIFSIALYFPNVITDGHVLKKTWKWIATALTPAWVLSTVASVLAGKSKASGTRGTQTWRDAVAKAGPCIFIAGLLCWVSYGIFVLLSVLQSKGWHHPLLWMTLGSVAVALILAWCVDINEFSMHLLYRNRLVRCYLGACNPRRAPNRFTGFDRNDDIALKDLRADQEHGYDGPYPIFNASLNLVKGQDLAWQERKAESFVMTPLYCGYDVWLEQQDSPMLNRERRHSKRFGYRPTEEYAVKPSEEDGLTLGTAMALSGAAASPNMGFYSSIPVAFLMTVFNVRLGQWLGNPRCSTFGRATPRFGLGCLLSELFAQTNDEARYVYLSDGGHFDNLGLYELVKRRCGLIIVCDAEADDQFKFTGLANAIRKCRIDLGIDIELDVSEIIPKRGSGFSKKHCAIGSIHYEQADVAAPLGTIIYFKASLTDNDPTDLKTYRKNHPLFPHESTIDQWFSESQFESYRQLGYRVVFNSVKPMPPTEVETAKPGLLSSLAGPLREALHAVGVDTADQHNGAGKPKPLEEHLRHVFDEFGFEPCEHPTSGSMRGSRP